MIVHVFLIYSPFKPSLCHMYRGIWESERERERERVCKPVRMNQYILPSFGFGSMWYFNILFAHCFLVTYCLFSGCFSFDSLDCISI